MPDPAKLKGLSPPRELYEEALHWFLKMRLQVVESSRACFPEGSEHTVLFLGKISMYILIHSSILLFSH